MTYTYVSTGVIYLVLLLLFFLKPEWEFVVLLLTVCAILKDLFLYVIELAPLQKNMIDFGTVHDLYVEKKLSTGYFLALLNRTYIFPLLLTVYLVYVLVKQTELWDLQLSLFFVSTNETLLLLLCIVSGIFLSYKQEKDSEFMSMNTSLLMTYAYVLLCIGLSLLTTYIIYTQVVDLGRIGTVISGLSGVLLFLVGALLMEDGE